MEADQIGRLRDILEAARLVTAYAKNNAEADFLTNTEKQDAIIRRLEIMGRQSRTLMKARGSPSPSSPSARCAA